LNTERFRFARYYKYIRSWCRFFQYYQYREERKYEVRATIKYRLKKKYASMETYCRFLYGIIWDPSNCGKTNVLINLLESPHSICFENMFSKLLQQQKYRYLKNLLVPIEEIDYFIHSLTMYYYHQTRRFQIPFLSSMMWHAISKTRSKSILRWVFHADVDCFYLCQTYAKHLIRDNANLLTILIWNMYTMIM